MSRIILYIGGGFDILHEDHKKFIRKGINSFKRTYHNLQKIIIGLKPDKRLNEQKGKFRPFFSYEWRKEDISNFLNNLNIDYKIMGSTDFFHKFRDRKDIIAGVSSSYLLNINKMDDSGVQVLPIEPINHNHTSTFETKLFETQEKSNCNIRKVGALLIRNGEIISSGYSGSGDCNCCSKYIAYKIGGGELSKKVVCDFPHAETIVLEKAKKDDDILITDSPCQKCADLIIKKGIRRVVYLQDYHDISPITYLKNNGIKVRKAGYYSY